MMRNTHRAVKHSESEYTMQPTGDTPNPFCLKSAGIAINPELEAKNREICFSCVQDRVDV